MIDLQSRFEEERPALRDLQMRFDAPSRRIFSDIRDEASRIHARGACAPHQLKIQNFHPATRGRKLKIQPLKLPSTMPDFLNLLKPVKDPGEWSGFPASTVQPFNFQRAKTNLCQLPPPGGEVPMSIKPSSIANHPAHHSPSLGGEGRGEGELNCSSGRKPALILILSPDFWLLAFQGQLKLSQG
jgi:hypothetical protein